MPYIPRNDRAFWNERILDITESVAEGLIPIPTDGQLNYYLTALLLRLLKPKSYSGYQNIIGLLECVKLEMYRAQVGPYEDVKRDENGNVN